MGHTHKFQEDFTKSFKFILLFSFLAHRHSKIDMLRPQRKIGFLESEGENVDKMCNS